MSPDVGLKAIQFKTAVSHPAIASVVCILSNEQHSPVFEKKGVVLDHSKTKTVTFNLPNPVRRLHVKTTTNMINSIFFMDKVGNEIESYEAQIGEGLEEQLIQLASNEEIFGVYGVKDSSDHFTSFGFIIKVIPTASEGVDRSSNDLLWVDSPPKKLREVPADSSRDDTSFQLSDLI